MVNGWSADVWSAALTAVEILTDVPPLAMEMTERHSKTGSIVIHAYIIYIIYYMNCKGLSFESIGENYKYHNKLAFQTWINALNTWSLHDVAILFQHFHKAMKGLESATLIDDSISNKLWVFKQKKVPGEILSLLERMLAKDLFSRTPLDVARQCRYFRENCIGEFGPEYQSCLRQLQRSQSELERELSSNHLLNSSSSSSSSSRHSSSTGSSSSSSNSSSISGSSSSSSGSLTISENKQGRSSPLKKISSSSSVVKNSPSVTSLPPQRSISFEESLSQTAKSSLGSTGVASRRFILLRDVMDAIRMKMSFQVSASVATERRRRRKAAGALIDVKDILDAFNRVAVPSPLGTTSRLNSSSCVVSSSLTSSSSSSSSSSSRGGRSASISRSKSTAPSNFILSASKQSSSSSSSSAVPTPPSHASNPVVSNSNSSSNNNYSKHNHSKHNRVLEIDRTGLETIFQSTGLSSIVGIKSSDLFDFLDSDRSGTVDRMELLAGLSIVLSEFADIRTRATLLYHAFDANLDGVLSVSEFSSLMDAYGIPHQYKKDILVKLFDSHNAATIESFIKVVIENDKFRNQLLAVT